MNENTRTDEQLNNVGKSADTASVTLDQLTAAAQRADSMFDNAFLKVRSVTDGLNALGFQKLAKVFGVFEARFQTLARMSDYGASFGYNIQSMDQAALNARMSLTQLANIVKESSETLTMFGDDTSDGAVIFTNIINSMQAQVTRFGRTTEENARLLGYSFDQLNETVLDYTAISGYARNRERFNETARNRSMGEYLDTVDELAKLTGKQRDTISDEMVKEARQGNNIIRARQLGERGDDYMQFLGSFRTEFGNTLGDLGSDMLGPGFGQTDDMRKLQGVLSPLSNAMDQLRKAYEDPTTSDAEIKRLQDSVRTQAAGVSDLEVMNLAVYNKVNATGGLLSQVITEQANLMAQTERYRDSVAQGENGRNLSLEEARRELIENTRKLQSGAMDPNAGPDTQAGQFQRYIRSQIELEQGTNKVRQSAVNAAYAHLTTTMSGLAEKFTGLNASLLTGAGNFTDTFSRLLTEFGDLSATQLQQELVQTRDQLQGMLGGQFSAQAGALLTELATQAAAIDAGSTPAERNEAIRQLESIVTRTDDLARQIRVINIDNAEINITDADLNRPNPMNPPDTMFGSMKAYGRLFNNYGEETMQPLHGLEAVTTPSQMADIVMNAASGGRSALAQDILNSGFQNNDSLRFTSAKIDSMLNTVSARLRDVTTTISQDTDTNSDQIINQFMNQLPKTLKTALEDALGSSLRPSLEQLISINAGHAETSDKIRKGVNGMSNDYMRGA